MRDRLISLIAHHSGVPSATIGSQQTLAGDLDLDSLDRIALGLVIEEEFGFDISDSDLDRPELGTVGGLCAFVEDRASAAPLRIVPAAAPLDLREPTGMETLFHLAHEADKSAEKHLRAAFVAGVRAGRCDPDPQAAWVAVKAELGL